MPRPMEKLPPGSRDALLSMAKHGLKASTAATALGIPLKDFRRIVETNQAAKELWKEALSVEHDALIEVMFSRAIEGDTKAAQYLLSARHGLSDKPTETSDRVSITLNIPAALSPEQYAKLVEVHAPSRPGISGPDTGKEQP
jgi:hypothetical protein